jgi:hypothetical protein
MERNNHPRSFELIELERRAALADTARQVAEELRRQAFDDAWRAASRAAGRAARRLASLVFRMLHRDAPPRLSEKR